MNDPDEACEQAEHHDDYSLLHVSGIPLELRIGYTEKETLDGATLYRNAVISYDADIIFADTVLLDTRVERGRMEVTGNVLIDDGSRRSRRDKVVVKLPREGTSHLVVEF